MARNTGLLFVLAVVSIVGIRCDLPFGDPGPIPDIGVRLSPGGAVEAAYRPCSRTFARVTEIDAFRTHGKIGRSDDDLLWRAQAEPPVVVSDFLLGAEIEGFRTEQSLVSLPATSVIALDLTSSDGSTASVVFELSELRMSDYLVIGNKKAYVSEESFNQLSHCR
jgi:hypothetical protein